MPIDRGKIRISLIGSVTQLGGNIVTGVMANLILYKYVLAPDYKAILIGVIIAIVMGMAIYIVIGRVPEKYHVKSAIISGILFGIVIGMIISPFPLFGITSPKDNSAVDHIITVRGCGGIPNSEIQVFVITNRKHPQPTTVPDATGKWTVYPVYIGEPHHSGLEAEIYALMTTPEGNVYESNCIKVKRK